MVASTQDGSPSPEGAGLRDLVTYVATNLVDDPASVQVALTERGHIVELRLKVDADEMGKVIGRQGRVAKALRALLAAAATRSGKRVNLEIG
ncbi:MAG: KH domain-containing protein [Chloroflexi bacterium]|nr:KH domain-containing protein [Chloroflexota bacterium]